MGPRWACLRWLLQAALRPLESLRALAHKRAIAAWLVTWALHVLPRRYRTRYREEWLAELDRWEESGQALLGLAIRITISAPRLGLLLLILDLARSPQLQRLRRFERLWVGVAAGTAAFVTTAVGLWTPEGRAPSASQVCLTLLGAVLTGCLAALQTKRPPGNRRRKRRRQTNRGGRHE
jgi:drug/metabolite transporter (DMT)-like permease